MAKTFSVKLQIVPLSGEPETRTVKVKASATLEEVLKAGNVDPKKKKFLVDGEPAELGARITASSSISVSEQVQGS